VIASSSFAGGPGLAWLPGWPRQSLAASNANISGRSLWSRSAGDTIDTGDTFGSNAARWSSNSVGAGGSVDLVDTSGFALWTGEAWRSDGALVAGWSHHALGSLVAVFSVLAVLALWSAGSLVARLALGSRGSRWANDARLLGNGTAQNLAVATVLAVVTVVAIQSSFSVIAGRTGGSGWSLLASTAADVRFGGNRWGTVAGLAILTLGAETGGLMLVQNSHFHPHIPGPSFAEICLDYQVTLEAGDVAVQHW